MILVDVVEVVVVAVVLIFVGEVMVLVSAFAAVFCCAGIPDIVINVVVLSNFVVSRS